MYIDGVRTDSKPAAADRQVDKQTKRVLFSDKNPLLMAGVEKLFSEGGDISCETVAQTTQLTELISVRRPDAVIVDPSQDGYQFHGPGDPSIKMIAYVEAATEDVLHGSLRAGFSAMIAKTSGIEELQSALTAAFAGGTFLDRVFTGLLNSSLNEDDPLDIPSVPQLSDREAQVLVDIASGRSLKQIAADMGLSLKTVDTYKTRAMKKLNLPDRAAVFTYAHQNGLLRQ